MTERFNQTAAYSLEPTYEELVYITDTMATLAQEAIFAAQNHSPLSSDDTAELYARGAEAELTQREFLEWGTELGLIPGQLNEDGSFQTEQAA